MYIFYHDLRNEFVRIPFSNILFIYIYISQIHRRCDSRRVSYLSLSLFYFTFAHAPICCHDVPSGVGALASFNANVEYRSFAYALQV